LPTPTGLSGRGGVPVTEIAALWTRGYPIDSAPAPRDLLLADPDRNQR
jgi:hypothetical protein